MPKVKLTKTALKQQRDSLKQFLVQRYYKDFVRSGALLSDSDKAKLRALNKEEATLSTEFQKRLLAATKAGAETRGLLVEDSRKASGNSEPTLSINAVFAGSGGEVYSTFRKGDRFQSSPPKPTFSITDAGGRTVANGNLEYG